jgi:D-alanine-D-alanine ligase-like ATP-grasp enzyme
MKILFLNSRGHWRNGWLTSPEELQIVANVLRKAGMAVEATEVENIPQLEKVLDDVSSDTLLWPNAYYVDAGGGKVAWLNDYIEARQLPYLGSNAKTLRTVLEKDACQALLRSNGLPIPEFTVITRENIGDIYSLISRNIHSFPVVLKPTAESGSLGVLMAKDSRQAGEYAVQILEEFPHSNVIIEEFLPSDDITCGFLQLGQEVMLLPTAYIVKSAAGKTNILSRNERLRPWDDEDKMQPYITDETILEQLKTHIPSIAAALNIQSITRIDGRLDGNGTLRFFDVNGLPALCFPEAVMVKQCFTCFPEYSQMAVFEGLIHTVVHQALLQYDMEAPEAMRRHNLFTMDSSLVIKSEAALAGMPSD